MKQFYIFLLTITIIVIVIFLATFGVFGYILYQKYAYLFKVIRKMENDKYLWPLNKKISNGIVLNINTKGSTLLIGVGSCSILEHLVKKIDKNARIDVIDSNKYLLELAKEKYGERCNYLEGDFIFHKFDKLYDNVISTLPHKEFVLQDIDRIFDKYCNLSMENIVYLESKMPHVKNSYVKMWRENKNKILGENKSKYEWELIEKKNYKNIPPVNLCILKKKLIQN